MIKKFIKYLIEEKLPYIDYVHEDYSVSQENLTKYINVSDKINILFLFRCFNYSLARKIVYNKTPKYESFLYNCGKYRYDLGDKYSFKTVCDKYYNDEITVSVNYKKDELVIMYLRPIDEYGNCSDCYQRFPLDIIRKYKSLRGFIKHFREQKIKEENNKRKREIENKKMEAIKRKREYEQYLKLKDKFDK